MTRLTRLPTRSLYDGEVEVGRASTLAVVRDVGAGAGDSGLVAASNLRRRPSNVEIVLVSDMSNENGPDIDSGESGAVDGSPSSLNGLLSRSSPSM